MRRQSITAVGAMLLAAGLVSQAHAQSGTGVIRIGGREVRIKQGGPSYTFRARHALRDRLLRLESYTTWVRSRTERAGYAVFALAGFRLHQTRNLFSGLPPGSPVPLLIPFRAPIIVPSTTPSRLRRLGSTGAPGPVRDGWDRRDDATDLARWLLIEDAIYWGHRDAMYDHELYHDDYHHD